MPTRHFQNRCENVPLLPRLALVLNILILLPVCMGLLVDAPWIERAYGEITDSRSILLAVYLAILAASIILFIRPDRRAIATLLAIQVFYKVLTPLTTGSLLHPVVLTNMGVAIFHLMALSRLRVQRISG